jgi:hypothetical protein
MAVPCAAASAAMNPERPWTRRQDALPTTPETGPIQQAPRAAAAGLSDATPQMKDASDRMREALRGQSPPAKLQPSAWNADQDHGRRTPAR